MFEVTGNDIANLGDVDLCELVKKLAVAEIRGQGCPISSVISGENQDAPDGGRSYTTSTLPSLAYLKKHTAKSSTAKAQ